MQPGRLSGASMIRVRPRFGRHCPIAFTVAERHAAVRLAAGKGCRHQCSGPHTPVASSRPTLAPRPVTSRWLQRRRYRPRQSRWRWGNRRCPKVDDVGGARRRVSRQDPLRDQRRSDSNPGSPASWSGIPEPVTSHRYGGFRLQLLRSLRGGARGCRREVG